MPRKLEPTAERVAVEKRIIKEGEDINQVFLRIARNIAQVEEAENKDLWTEKFFWIMSENYFLPNYPCLVHGQREDGRVLGTLSACFVLDVEDSRTSIFNTLRDAAEVQALAGGTGFNFSKLRERGAKIESTGGTSSGPVSFMKVFDLSLGDIIKQGSTRPGANMGILNYNHPDIMEFINIKSDRKTLNNFNLSVLVDDEFIRKAKEGEMYDLVSPKTKEKVGELNAGMVLDEIAKNAINNGCPGVLFYENANKNNPLPEPFTTTNPCGETFLYPLSSCNLGSINLKQILLDEVDDDKFKDIVATAVRFLDNMLDINFYPVIGMKEAAKKYRQIGLGMMGVADALFMEKISYASEQGRKYITSWYKKFQEAAIETSKKLAEERGSFGAFEESSFKEPRRNSFLTLQAPTGTLSILAGCSAGIEPWFGLYQRTTTSKGTLVEQVNPIFQTYMKKRKLWNDDLINQIKENNGSIKGIPSIPQDVQDIFMTALDIPYQDHIYMQAEVQKILDNSISKTINMNKDATPQMAKEAILLAHHLGCKGLTIYKDGSKDNQPISIKDKEKPKDIIKAASRSKVMTGQTEKISVGQCGNIFVTTNAQDGRIREMIMNKGSSGGCTNAMMEGMARLITLAFSKDCTPEEVSDQLKDIKCDQVCYDYTEEGKKPDKITSCPMVAAVAIERFMRRNGLGVSTNGKMIRCPKCNEFSVIKDGSCEHCTAGCGYSKC